MCVKPRLQHIVLSTHQKVVLSLTQPNVWVEERVFFFFRMFRTRLNFRLQVVPHFSSRERVWKSTHARKDPPPCSSPYWLPNTETIVLLTNQNHRLNMSLVTAIPALCAKHAGVISDESLLYEFENNWNMNLNSKKKSTRVCVGLFFLLGGIEYGESFSCYVCKQV